MKKICLLTGVLLLLFGTALCRAATITYYYSERCDNCRFLTPYWQQFAADNAASHVLRTRQTDESPEIKNELLNLNMQYRGLAHTSTPAVLVTGNTGGEDVLLIGVDEINHLPEILGQQKPLIPDLPVRALTTAIITSNGKMPASLLYPFTLAAVADASNPCALFVFIAAVSYALVFCGRSRAVLYAVTFCATMITIYLGAGLAGQRLIRLIFGASPWVSLVLSLGLLALAVLHLWTAIFPASTKYSELPYKIKKLLLAHAGKCVSFGGAIASGTLCALVEMPCTGGPYIFALNIIAKMPLKTALLWLVYYNLIFIAPLLFCLTVLLVAPQYVKKLDEWRIAYRRWLHLAMGTLLFMAASFGLVH